MRSRSHSEGDGFLAIRAAEATTEIFVVGQRFQRVGSGVGSLDISVPAGFYKIRFRSGTVQEDRLVEVEPGGRVQVHGEPLAFDASAPLGHSRTDREEQRRAARRESGRPHVDRGKGSELFLFARDFNPDGSETPETGVSLHTADGSPLADFGEGVRSVRHGFAALTVSVDPGTYRLRVETGPLGIYEMFVVACPGWQTQVFGLAADFQFEQRGVRRIQLKTVSMFMSPIGQGFDPDAPTARLTELARLGLETGRNVVRGDEIQSLLRGTIRDPMLGIMAAHLLLLERRPDHDTIEAVARNVRSLIGPHPDLDALRLRSKRQARKAGKLFFATPPMLRSSWDLIVQKSLRRRSIVPDGTLTDLVADGLLEMGPWLLYRHPETAASPSESLGLPSTRRVIQNLVELSSTSDGRSALGKALGDPATFSPLEQKIIRSAMKSESFERSADTAREEAAEGVSGASPAQIIRQLNVPSASVARSAKGILDKLDLSDTDMETLL